MGHLARRLPGKVAASTAIGASLLLAALSGIGAAVAAVPSAARSLVVVSSRSVPDVPDVRQAETGTWPGMSTGSSSPADVELVDLLIRDLPVKVQAGESFAARVAVPSGSSCSGTIAYPNRPEQPLDEVGARTDACAWELGVPYGTRPGTAVITIEVSRRGQGRILYGVTYVDVTSVGRADGGAGRESSSPGVDG